MSIEFPRFERSQASALAQLLASEDWPYHSGGTPSAEDVMERVAHGDYDDEFVRTFWVVEDGSKVGLLRLEDVGDGTPLFDLRIRASHRGRGLGTRSVEWLTAYLFEEFADLTRIEGTTRQDNAAMRRVLRRCGYVKEAHYREAWPGADGGIHDTVGYAILRSDWVAAKVTEPEWNDEASPKGTDE